MGWYAVVRIRLDPNSLVSSAQRFDSNWRPRSVVMVDGVPNHAIQPLTKASATDSAVMLVRGKASGQRVNLSMHVSR